LIVRLRPDLIVTQAQCDVCAIRYDDVAALVEREPTLRGVPLVALNPLRLDDIFADVLRLGAATDRGAAAERYVADLRRRVEAVRARTGGLPPEQRRRTACLEWIDPPMIAANWTPELVDLAGGTQPLAIAGRHSTYTPWDAIRAFDPEVIVIMPCGFDLSRTIDEAAVLRNFPGWRELGAVRAGTVYAVDGNALFNRSGPRIVDSLELLAKLIHPELHGIAPSDPGEAPWWRRFAT
jgi:iron complex transport system substrate-binding protein